MGTIRDLSPAQIARHAFNVFLFNGRHVVGARLTYHALAMDPYEPAGIRCLSDLMDRDPLEVYSAAALEYAVAPSTPLAPADRAKLDDHLFFAKWSWGFSKHVSGSSHLSGAEFARREDFTVDEGTYTAWLGELLTPAGSIENAFFATLKLAGAMGGLIQHPTLGTKVGLEDLVKDDQFEVTPLYSQWLESGTEELDALEERRQRDSKR